MGQEMDSVLPFLLILIFTLDQNTFPPKSQHEENDEENDDHEENDDEHGNQEETYQDEDCCTHLQPVSSQMPTYEENGKTMEEPNKTVLKLTGNLDMGENVTENLDMDEKTTENLDMEELAEKTETNYDASGNFQKEKEK